MIKVGAAVTKGNTDLAKALQSEFTKMNNSGSYKKILDTWHMTSLAYKF